MPAPRHDVVATTAAGLAPTGLAPPVFGGSAATSDTMIGIDGRNYRPVIDKLIVASHAAFRYMPSTPDAPFWVLGSLGGDRSFLAGPRPLRAFGANRMTQRASPCRQLRPLRIISAGPGGGGSHAGFVAS